MENEDTVEAVVETEQVEPVKEADKTDRKVRTSTKEVLIKDKQDAILELRKENEKLRKTLEDVSNEKAERMALERIEQAKADAKAEAQKLLDARLTEMEERSKARIVRTELKAAAMRAGVVDFDDAYQIMQRGVLTKVEFDDDGGVKNAAELMAEFKEAKPHLFGGVNTSSTTQAPPPREHKVEKTALDMNPEEYRKARAKLVMM